MAVVSHTPYSPDLLSCDFFLLPRIKSQLREYHCPEVPEQSLKVSCSCVFSIGRKVGLCITSDWGCSWTGQQPSVTNVTVYVIDSLQELLDVSLPSRCQACSHSREKRLLPLSCPSVRLNISVQLPLDRFPWNLILGIFMEICRGKPDLVKIGQNHRALHMKAKLCLIVAGDMKSPYKRSLRLKWYQTRGAPKVGMPGCSPPNPPKPKLKKNRFCRPYDIKSFTWFPLQPKSATETGWWLIH
jgi:hypothetical protein